MKAVKNGICVSCGRIGPMTKVKTANKKIRWSCAACEKARRKHCGTVG